MNKNKRIVYIGVAWPYANGSLHLGHVAGLMGCDILARYHRLKGDGVLMVSGSDCHGTPITIEAMNQGIEPKEIAEKYDKEFRKTLIDGLGFSYDLYTNTLTDNHEKVVQDLFLKLLEKGYLEKKTEKSLFSPLLNRYLPDRFVEGQCPNCDYKDARGDQCDECGSLLDALELVGPRINKKILPKDKKYSEEELGLEIRDTEHFYLILSKLQPELEKFVAEKSDGWRLNAKSWAKGMLEQGLRDRAVTRDTDWGVSIPVEGYEDKKIYVWFEAVSGYLSASVEWAKKQGDESMWKEFWKGENLIHYYVHGKDNIPFHTIIWPGILIANGDLHLPDKIVSSEYLTLENKQFSKSRNWAVWLPDYLENFEADALRFYLVVNGPETSDANFSWEEYKNMVNGELIGTVGNLANRVLAMSKKNFPEGLKKKVDLNGDSRDLLKLSEEVLKNTGELIEKTEFRKAWQELRRLAEAGNKYLEVHEPWKKMKEDDLRGEAETDLWVLVSIIEVIGILLEPFTPHSSDKLCEILQLNKHELGWNIPKAKEIYLFGDIQPLFRKIEDEEIERELSKLGGGDK